MLTQEEIAYGQQKNREHMWNQAMQERKQYKEIWAQVFNKPVEPWSELDESMTCKRYEILCRNANITAW